MKSLFTPLDEQRRIVAYLDGLQAQVNALRELPHPPCRAASAFSTSPKYDDENYVCGFSHPLVVFGGGRVGAYLRGADAVRVVTAGRGVPG